MNEMLEQAVARRQKEDEARQPEPLANMAAREEESIQQLKAALRKFFSEEQFEVLTSEARWQPVTYLGETFVPSRLVFSVQGRPYALCPDLKIEPGKKPQERLKLFPEEFRGDFRIIGIDSPQVTWDQLIAAVANLAATMPPYPSFAESIAAKRAALKEEWHATYQAAKSKAQGCLRTWLGDEEYEHMGFSFVPPSLTVQAGTVDAYFRAGDLIFQLTVTYDPAAPDNCPDVAIGQGKPEERMTERKLQPHDGLHAQIVAYVLDVLGLEGVRRTVPHA